MDIEKLKYPIGQFVMADVFNMQQANCWISAIETLPHQIDEVTKNLNNQQLDKTYRPGGWTLRQVIHHLPDSHMNAYIRFKLALTETNPTIRPYEEGLWAETFEAKYGEIEMSVTLLRSIHHRWVAFLKSLTEDDFSRTYIHPAQGKTLTLAHMLGMYAWHGEHHLAHLIDGSKEG